MRFSLIIPAMFAFMVAAFVGAPEARAASVTPAVAPAVTQDVAQQVHYRRYRHHRRWRPYYGYGYGPSFYFSFGPRYRHYGYRRYYGHRYWRHRHYGYGHRSYRRHYRRHWY